VKKLGAFPHMEKQIKAWLKAGVMEGYANTQKQTSVYPTSKGTPQGGVISPLLANIALHGLENHLKQFIVSLPIQASETNVTKAARKKSLAIIRFLSERMILF
jgi:RNA-directed DNA polymerase